MNLWFSSLLLVGGAFLGASAVWIEECKPLIKPYETFEPRYGNWTFIMGYIDSKPFKDLFRGVESMWLNYKNTSSDGRDFIQEFGMRRTTHCKYGSHPMTIFENTALSSRNNFTCTFHSMPTHKNFLVYMVNSRNNNELLNVMNIAEPETPKDVKYYRALYLMAKRKVLCEDDLDHFRTQAKCLGFPGEPDFFYDPTKTMCSESPENST